MPTISFLFFDRLRQHPVYIYYEFAGTHLSQISLIFVQHDQASVKKKSNERKNKYFCLTRVTNMQELLTIFICDIQARFLYTTV